LLHLAPDTQEAILFLPRVAHGRDPEPGGVKRFPFLWKVSHSSPRSQNSRIES
jgi:hypothetical protein